MYIKDNKMRLLIAIIVLLVIIIIGISYAWLRTVKYGDKDVKITVGDFDLVLNEPGDGISLINALPTYDEEGKSSSPYEFSLENKSNIELYYTLSLVDDEEALSSCESSSGGDCELLDSRDVRYELKLGDRTFTGSLSD